MLKVSASLMILLLAGCAASPSGTSSVASSKSSQSSVGDTGSNDPLLPVVTSHARAGC